MYTRLIQAHEAMDAELKAASAYAAKQLRLMVTSNTYKYPFLLIREICRFSALLPGSWWY